MLIEFDRYMYLDKYYAKTIGARCSIFIIKTQLENFYISYIIIFQCLDFSTEHFLLFTQVKIVLQVLHEKKQFLRIDAIKNIFSFTQYYVYYINLSMQQQYSNTEMTFGLNTLRMVLVLYRADFHNLLRDVKTHLTNPSLFLIPASVPLVLSFDALR